MQRLASVTPRPSRVFWGYSHEGMVFESASQVCYWLAARAAERVSLGHGSSLIILALALDW